MARKETTRCILVCVIALGVVAPSAAAPFELSASVSLAASFSLCGNPGSAGLAKPGDPLDVSCVFADSAGSVLFSGSSVVANTGDVALSAIWNSATAASGGAVSRSVELVASVFDTGVIVQGATGPNGFLSIVPRATGFSSTTCFTTIVNSPGGCTFHNYFRSTLTALGVNDFNLLNVTFDATINETGLEKTVTREILPGDLSTVFRPATFGVPFNLTYQNYTGFSVTTTGRGWVNESTIQLLDPPLIQIYDANMNLLPDARLVSQAGVNYGPVATAVPEPATLGLLGLGLAGVAAMRRRKPSRPE